MKLEKHQKIVESIQTMSPDEAKQLFAEWQYNGMQSYRNSIRQKLRDFGWYIVKTRIGSYELMEEVFLKDVCPDRNHPDNDRWESIFQNMSSLLSSSWIKQRGYCVVNMTLYTIVIKSIMKKV